MGWQVVKNYQNTPGSAQRFGERTLSSISFRNQNEKQLTILFPELREDTLRIVIANEDNPRLRIKNIEGEGVEKRLFFLAQPDRTYQVKYHSSDAEPPRYETGTILSRLKTETGLLATKLGPVVENANAIAKENRANCLNNWYFLGSAMALMVAVLVWSLLTAGKKLKDLPEEGKQ